MFNGDSIDKELANVYLYITDKSLDDFILQEEEVSRMVKINFNEFVELWLGERISVYWKLELNQQKQGELIREVLQHGGRTFDEVELSLL